MDPDELEEDTSEQVRILLSFPHSGADSHRGGAPDWATAACAGVRPPRGARLLRGRHRELPATIPQPVVFKLPRR